MRTYLETDGFKFNPYDPCVANKIIEGKPLPIVFRVDDLKSSRNDTKVVDNFEKLINFTYVDPNFGKIKSVRVNIHEYLSMTLDYTTKVEVKIDMQKYVKNVIDEFPMNIEKCQAVAIRET